jgi:putative tricarboxylic transport membrane protein
MTSSAARELSDGDALESNAINTNQISGGDPAYILERPAAVAVLVLMALSFGATAWSQHRRQKQKLAGEDTGRQT